MTDSTLNRFVASGTNAERLAFTPSPPTPGSGPDPSYVWHETDTGDTYMWRFGTADWEQVNTAAGVTNLSTSLSQVSSSLSTEISTRASADTSLSTAISTVDANQSSSISTNLSKINSLSTAVSTVVSSSISAVNSSVSSLSTAIGSGGGAWALAGAGWTVTGVYDQAVDGNQTSVAFTGLAGKTDILIICRLLTLASSGVAVLRVSTNNGLSFFSSSGDYVNIASTTGIEANATDLGMWATSATAARSGNACIVGANVLAPRLLHTDNPNNGRPTFFVADDANDIDAVQVIPSAGGNITGGKIYCFAR